MIRISTLTFGQLTELILIGHPLHSLFPSRSTMVLTEVSRVGLGEVKAAALTSTSTWVNLELRVCTRACTDTTLDKSASNTSTDGRPLVEEARRVAARASPLLHVEVHRN
jgi:hypothetical protein